MVGRSVKLKTGNDKYPVSRKMVKQYMGIDQDNTDHDGLLIRLIGAAVKTVESRTERKLLTQTWYQYEKDWPLERDYIELLLNPVQSVTGIGYMPYTDSDYTSWSSSYWSLDETIEPARLWVNPLQSWPTAVLHDVKPIQIEYIVGYGNTAEDVDEDLILAIMMLVEHLFDNRGVIVVGTVVAKLPNTVEDILDQKISFYSPYIKGWEGKEKAETLPSLACKRRSSRHDGTLTQIQ